MVLHFDRVFASQDNLQQTEQRAFAAMQQIVKESAEYAASLSPEQKTAAKAELIKRASKEWWEHKKGEREPNNINSVKEAIALFANAGNEVVKVKKSS